MNCALLSFASGRLRGEHYVAVLFGLVSVAHYFLLSAVVVEEDRDMRLGSSSVIKLQRSQSQTAPLSIGVMIVVMMVVVTMMMMLSCWSSLWLVVAAVCCCMSWVFDCLFFVSVQVLVRATTAMSLKPLWCKICRYERVDCNVYTLPVVPRRCIPIGNLRYQHMTGWVC